MIVTPIKTGKVVVGDDLYELLDKFLPKIKEKSVVAITSKVIAICEGRTLPIAGTDKDELILQEADYYLPRSVSKYNYRFTINNNTLISAAGIDESNGDDKYVLWPVTPQKSANEIREYLAKRFKLKQVGVLITDSSVYPLRYGTLVIPIAHSGFLAKKDYRGKPDLFGRPFQVSVSSIAGGLAAASGVVMGEGTEQTPIVILDDLPGVSFQSRNPTEKELKDFYISIHQDDLFAPFLRYPDWIRGGKK